MSSPVLPVSSPEWLDPLHSLLTAVCSPEPGKAGLAKMITSLAEVETLLSRHRADMPPQLVHYLERRSYDKAMRYCAGEATLPRGTCAPKN